MSVKKRYKKPTVGPHSRKVKVNNPIKQFSRAYQYIKSNPHNRYKTTGGKPFTAEAETAKSGNHKGKEVIRFKSGTQSVIRVYKCCWNLQSNCGRTRRSGTHIDTYTQVIGLPTKINIKPTVKMKIIY